MRHVIETERVDLFDVNIVITMRVLLDREIEFDRLKEAFDKACSVHEVLGSKVVLDASGEAYYEKADGQNNSFTKTDSNLLTIIKENQKKRFKIENGEFMRGFLSPDGLVFMMHHLGGDGKSLLYFIETFMNCLEGKECEFVPFKNLTLENLPAESEVPFFYKWLVKRWNKSWEKEKKIFDFSDMDREYESFWNNHETKIEIRRYEKEELTALLRKSKEAGVSLTAYVIADMIKDSDKANDIGLAVDGRTDANRSMGNQATGISVKYKYDPGKTVEENAKAVSRLMQKKLSDDRYRFFVLKFMGLIDPTLKDSLNLEHAGCFSGKTSAKVAELLGYGNTAKDISITNLTRVDIPLEYGDVKIEEIAFIPPIVSYAKNVYGMVTANDVMIVSRHIYE